MWSRHLLKANARQTLRRSYLLLIICGIVMRSPESVSSLCGFDHSQFAYSAYPELFQSMGHTGLQYLFDLVRYGPFWNFLCFCVLYILILWPLKILATKIMLDRTAGNPSMSPMEGCRFLVSSYFRFAAAGALKVLFQILWTLALIIPGILSVYRYSMLPYILAEEPELSPMEAIRKSCSMTSGYIPKLIFLDLSMIPYNFLSIFLHHIFYFVYSAGYISQVWTEAYLFIRDPNAYSLRYLPKGTDQLVHNRQSRALNAGMAGTLVIIMAGTLMHYDTLNTFDRFVNESWMNVTTSQYIIAILLLCIGIPMFTGCLDEVYQIYLHHSQTRTDMDFNMRSLMQFSITVTQATVLFTNMAECILPIIYRSIYLAENTGLAGYLSKQIAGYIMGPVLAFRLIYIAGISLPFMHMVLTGRSELPKIAVLCTPAAGWLLLQQVGTLFIHEGLLLWILKNGTSVGWFLLILCFRIIHQKEYRKQPSSSA